jgi:hypothetical protein
MTDPYPIQLPAPGTIPEPKPPKTIRFVHVAATGDAHMAWAMGWLNTRIADLDAEIIAIAHACALGGADNPALYSTVITYQCPVWAAPVPPIPPYPGP